MQIVKNTTILFEPIFLAISRKMPLMKDLHKKLTAVFCKNSDGQSNVSML